MPDFNIGDFISGNFTMEDPGFTARSKKHRLLTRNGKLYVRYHHDNNEIDSELTPSPGDREAHKIIDHANRQDKPILKLDRVSGQQYVVHLFSYARTQEVTDENPLYVYFDSLKEKEIANETGSSRDVAQTLRLQFMHENSVFVRMNDANQKVIEIIGTEYSLTALQEANAKNLYRIQKFRPRKNRNQEFNRNIVHLYGKIQFINQGKIASVLSRTKKDGLIVENAPSKFLQYWKAYNQIEWEVMFQEAKEFGSFKVKDVRETPTTIEVVLEDYDSAKIVENHRANEALAIANKPLTDELIESIQNKNIQIMQVHISAQYDVSGNTVVFDKDDIQDSDLDELLTLGYDQMYLVYSLKGFLVNHSRKKKVMRELTDGKSNVIKDLIINQSVQSLLSFSNKKTTSKKLIEKTFGSSDYAFTDSQLEALDIAINSPDIALIQGPPGTGKTMIIKAIVNRINELSQNISPKILISCEQHEALENVVFDIQEGLPPTIISRRRGDAEEDMYRNVIDFSEKFIAAIKRLIPDKNKKEQAKIDFYRFYMGITNAMHDSDEVMKNLESITELVESNLKEKKDDLLEKIMEIKSIVNNVSRKRTVSTLEKILHSQRTTVIAFEDDGKDKLNELFWQLEVMHPDDYQLGENIYKELSETDAPSPELMSAFEGFVDTLKEKHLSSGSNHQTSNKVTDLLDGLYADFFDALDRENNTREDILAEFIPHIANPLAMSSTIDRYSLVFGSTAQQSLKTKKIDKSIWFDYVIIDEASRVNPIDLLIPMMFGERIILVGDQAQLPHYVEQELITKVKKSSLADEEAVTDVLETSLFQKIFDLVKEKYDHDEIAKRHVVLDTQYRMHPTICGYISSEFYDNKLRTGLTKDERQASFGLADDKPVAWYDIDTSYGLETSSVSRVRKVEIDAVFSLIDQLVRTNASDMPSVGIISYYKGQINAIRERALKVYPSRILDALSFGTVDSFQGKEFDIVVLCTVRSNMHDDIRKRIGFLNHAPSRINVSFSRAKYQMIVIGDSTTIAYRGQQVINTHFHNFLSLVKQEGYYHDKKD